MRLFGPSRTPSLGEKSYVYVIVDDFSRYTCVMFEFQAFSKFCKKVQNEKDFSITCIRSDHKREFENIDFEFITMSMELTITFQLLKLFNKMGS